MTQLEAPHRPVRAPTRRSAGAQIHVRTTAAEHRALVAAATAAGFRSPGQYLLALAAAARDNDRLRTHVDKGLAALGDRLAAEIAASAGAVAQLEDAVRRNFLRLAERLGVRSQGGTQ